jgi:hypothetical protein
LTSSLASSICSIPGLAVRLDLWVVGGAAGTKMTSILALKLTSSKFPRNDTIIKVQAKRPIPEISKVKVDETNVEDDANDLLVNGEHVDEGIDTVNDKAARIIIWNVQKS